MTNKFLKPNNSESQQHISSPKMRFRSGFTINNLLASAHFTQEANLIEAENQGKPLGPFWDEIRWKVTAAVLMSCTALEANINEVIFSESESIEKDNSRKQTYTELLESKSISILEKYQQFFKLSMDRALETGAGPYQSVYCLVRFRNALVHFIPEWTDEQTKHEKINRQLKGKFQPSSFFSETEPLFPDRCMSADCARWATSASLDFIQVFQSECGLMNRFGEKQLQSISEFLSN